MGKENMEKWVIFSSGFSVRIPRGFRQTQRRNSGPTYQRLLRSEAGAVSVDWIVLTAATVMLSVAVLSQVSGGTQELSADLRKCLKIQAKLVAKDIPYERQQKRIIRRCSKL